MWRSLVVFLPLLRLDSGSSCKEGAVETLAFGGDVEPERTPGAGSEDALLLKTSLLASQKIIPGYSA
jgi:hypothetical protein